MPYYIIIPFRPVLAAGALLALPLVLVRGWCSLLVVTGTAASRRQCRPCHLCWWYRSPVSAVSPVVASGWPVGGRWWCRSARRSALPRYVINRDIFEEYISLCKTFYFIPFCRPAPPPICQHVPPLPSLEIFYFYFFYFGPRSPILDSWPFLSP